MKYIVSRYNDQDVSWIKEYSDDVVIYDRSDKPVKEAIVVPNLGSDIYDKLTYIIDNYDNLPDVAVYTKANLFKYITKDEFDKLKDNRTFTPLLTQKHKVYEPTCRYVDGIYEEINNFWYLDSHPVTHSIDDLVNLLGTMGKRYVRFAPGSNYILPRGNILKHSKEFYVKLRSFLEGVVYPGEAQIIERGLYTIWQ